MDESLADQATEAQKLQERLGLAWQEYSSGANKLKSTNRQLQALANRVSKNDAKAQGALRCDGPVCMLLVPADSPVSVTLAQLE